MRFKFNKCVALLGTIVVVSLLLGILREQVGEHSWGENLQSQNKNGERMITSMLGGQVFGTLQIFKDPREFRIRVRTISRTNRHLAEYLTKTHPLSLKFAHLTEMGDAQAMALPVIRTNQTIKSETVIYNRINKCGSSTLLSKHFLLSYVFIWPLVFPALISGVMYTNQIQLALQGSPTHRSIRY